jgi:hypothetical protein
MHSTRLYVAAAIAATTLSLSLPASAGPAGKPGPAPTCAATRTTTLNVSRLQGVFTLTPDGAPKVKGCYTLDRYTANSVEITIAPLDPTLPATTLLGDMVVTTETTADADGNGVITGLIVFKSGNQTLMATISGLVGAFGGPSMVQGQILTAPTKANPRPAKVDVAAYLSLDSSGYGFLMGYAATTTTSK